MGNTQEVQIFAFSKSIANLNRAVIMQTNNIAKSEIMDLRKEKNFFETRVTEYQTGGALAW